jgi:hypothetical protein
MVVVGARGCWYRVERGRRREQLRPSTQVGGQVEYKGVRGQSGYDKVGTPTWGEQGQQGMEVD